MLKRKATRVALAILLSTVAGSVLAQDKVKLTFLFDNAPSTVAMAEALATAFEAKHPNIDVETESRPGGGDGDNIIKTRLATGEMSDVFLYNSGSLFQAMNPTQNLVDLTGEAFQANVIDSFKTVVTGTDGKVYGAPIGTAMGGGILYNIPIYKELGLSVPKSWAEFEANNEKIKAAGKTAVIQTFGATWTSQLFVLGDFYNVLASAPNFATEYTAGKAKYASTPAAMKGFERQEEVFKAGYLNEDFAAATFEDGVTKVATGEGAHYPMLSFAVAQHQGTSARARQRCRLLRHSRRRCRQQRPDHLDAGRPLHPQDHQARSRGQGIHRLRRQHRRLRYPDPVRRRDRPIPGEGLHSANRRAAGGGRPVALLPGGRPLSPGSRVPLPDQGAGARADHG